MPTPCAVLEFESVSKRFQTDARGDVWALRDFNLTCGEGELTCLVGPSGCGKTTLLRLAMGLEQPTQGRVRFHSQPVDGPPPNIGAVSQEGDLLPWRRVADNVALGLELRGVRGAERATAARRVLRRVHLPAEIERSFPHELSGGMRQRVALARALCHNPAVLLMDEPFASVDEPTRHRLQDELLHIWAADRQTILFVTHSVEEAVYLADRVVVMSFEAVLAQLPVPLPRPRDRFNPVLLSLIGQARQRVAGHHPEAK